MNLKQSPLDIIDEPPASPFPSAEDCIQGASARSSARDSTFGHQVDVPTGVEEESKAAVVSPLTFLLPHSVARDQESSRDEYESDLEPHAASPGRRRKKTMFGRSGHEFVEIRDSDIHDGARDSTATHLLRASVRTVTDTVLGVTSTAVGAVTATATTAEQVMRNAAENAPVLKDILRPRVHSGFYRSYAAVREFVHALVRSELATEPADVLVSGHSLGGALAVICALDISLHTVTPMNNLCRSHFPQSFRESHITMYNFGAPGVGNRSFAQLYNKIVPDSFRVVVDGDPVPGVLGFIGYNHVGTEVQIDGVGDSGTIIIGPSFVERRLRSQKGNPVLSHSLHSYRSGLTAIADAANYFSQVVAEDEHKSHSEEAAFVDIIQATLQARGLVEEKGAETKRIKKAIAKL